MSFRDIDEQELKSLMRMYPSLKDVAAFYECSEDTIENRIRTLTGLTFSEFRDKNMVETRFHLIRKAIKMAEDGNSQMLIFALKNLCKWTDKVEVEAGDKTQNLIKLAYKIE